MKVREQVPLSDHTTFRVGGSATLFISVDTAGELPGAYHMARERGLSAYPLGEGSNVLAYDGKIDKAIIRLSAAQISYEDTGDEVRVIADGGMQWDTLVTETTARDLWGLENLAAIPGTVGAAPVQNIGAYGKEVMDAIESVEGYDPETDTFVTYAHDDCGFSYRDSRFKRTPGVFITRVTFKLSRTPRPELSYADVAARVAAGADVSTPARIAQEVRTIRAQKFPDLREWGTAGSFFKNPVISADLYTELHAQYPELKGYEVDGGVKIPIAWILDHVLFLRGHTLGPVKVYENHALVLVTSPGAKARDVAALADDVAKRVHDATNIVVEREVQTLT